MPTDHACQSAAEFAAPYLTSLRPFLQPGHPHAETQGFDDWSIGASALLVVLGGLQADRPGELAQWHARVGYQIREALGLPVAGSEGQRPGRQPRGWEALTLVQRKAQELLTDLANRGRTGRPGELSAQLELVEDALAGALRRAAVPEEAATQCAAGLSEAAGSLFGLRPSAPRQASAPAPHQAPPPPPTVPIVTESHWTRGILF